MKILAGASLIWRICGSHGGEGGRTNPELSTPPGPPNSSVESGMGGDEPTAAPSPGNFKHLKFRSPGI